MHQPLHLEDVDEAGAQHAHHALFAARQLTQPGFGQDAAEERVVLFIELGLDAHKEHRDGGDDGELSEERGHVVFGIAAKAVDGLAEGRHPVHQLVDPHGQVEGQAGERQPGIAAKVAEEAEIPGCGEIELLAQRECRSSSRIANWPQQ